MNMPERPLQPCQPAFNESIQFDEFQDEHVREILGNERLAKPLQKLLLILHQISLTSRSFSVDKAKAYDALMPNLEWLREACRDAWADL